MGDDCIANQKGAKESGKADTVSAYKLTVSVGPELAAWKAETL